LTEPPEPYVVESSGRGRRVAVTAMVGVAQRLVQFGSMLLVMPMVLGGLGAEGFGLWGAVTSVAWLSSLADLGIGWGLVTPIAREVGSGQLAKAQETVTASLVLGFSLGLVFLSLAMLAKAVVPPGRAIDLYLLAMAALALNVPLSSASSLWMSMQRGYLGSGWEAFQTILVILLAALAGRLHGGVGAYVAAVYGGILLGNLASLLHFLHHFPELRPRWVALPISILRENLGRGLRFFILGLTTSFAIWFDNILALELLGPAASAQMAVASRVCISAVGLLGVISQPLWPAFADAIARRDKAWIRASLVKGMVVTVGGAVIGAALLVALGEPLLRLWLHTDLEIGRSLLWAMAAWIVTQCLLRVPDLLLNALLMLRFQICTALVYGLSAFILKFLLADRLGVGGILWATTIAYLTINVPAFALWFSKRVRLS
jgi:O-antigen/teichoic acid export membrane protein